ncbi:MAG TPA: hypothetical protein VE890_03050 [Thermoguttaceae bacterium]|nr:hypothetical protein [Thermoguttaceae bacterium]
MASSSRTTQFAKLAKVLKKQHYKPVTSDPERPVLEHLLLGCCLENAHYDVASEAYAALDHTFFDWNEVRVTSIAELSEIFSRLPDPREAAHRVKRVLQAIFEESYSFDLEEYRKKNLGPTVKWLKELDGTTNFVVSYVVQAALGGHAIPVDAGTLAVLRLVDMITDKDVKAGAAPGLERAIAKAKGVEFGSVLHQLGADFTANPYSPAVRKILLEINPDIKDQLPKRRARKQPKEPQPAKTTTKKDTSGKAPAATKSQKQTAAKKTAARPSSKAKKATASTAKKASSAKKKPTEKASSGTKKKGKSTTKGLSKRKPR